MLVCRSDSPAPWPAGKVAATARVFSPCFFRFAFVTLAPPPPFWEKGRKAKVIRCCSCPRRFSSNFVPGGTEASIIHKEYMAIVLEVFSVSL